MKSEFSSNIWKMYIVTFLRYFMLVSGVLIPFYLDWGGITFAQTLFLQSWFLFSVFILEVPTGVVADKWSRKLSIALGCAVVAIASLVYGSIPNFYIFMLGEFLFAVGVSLMSGADTALFYDTLKKMRNQKKSKKYYARYKSFGLAGMILAAPLGSFIGISLGLNFPMLLESIPYFLGFIIALSLKEPNVKKESESERYVKILKEGILHFKKSKELKILALDLVIISSLGYFLIWTYQAMLKSAGVDIFYFGFVHSLMVAGQIIFMNNYERVEVFLGSKKRLIVLSSLLTGLLLILGGLFTAYLPIAVLVAVLGLTFSKGRNPLIENYMNKYIPSKRRATVLSAVSMLERIVLVVLNPIVGFAVDFSLGMTLLALGLVGVAFSFVSKIEEDTLID